jgi:hypothetical protein
MFLKIVTKMMNLKRISFIILFINSLLMWLYGVGIIVKPQLIIGGLEVYATTIFTKQNSYFQNYIILLIQLLGCFNIVAAVSGIAAIRGYLKHKLHLFLWAIFFCNIVAYGCSVSFDLTTGVIGIIEVVEIVVFVLSLIAFMIIAYETFIKKA